MEGDRIPTAYCRRLSSILVSVTARGLTTERGNQGSSRAIGGHHGQSGVITGNQGSSRAIGGHHGQSGVITGNQRSSDAHQRGAGGMGKGRRWNGEGAQVEWGRGAGGMGKGRRWNGEGAQVEWGRGAGGMGKGRRWNGEGAQVEWGRGAGGMGKGRRWNGEGAQVEWGRGAGGMGKGRRWRSAGGTCLRSHREPHALSRCLKRERDGATHTQCTAWVRFGCCAQREGDLVPNTPSAREGEQRSRCYSRLGSAIDGNGGMRSPLWD